MMKRSVFALLFPMSLAGGLAKAQTDLPVTQDNHYDRPLGAGYDHRKQALRADCVEARHSGPEPTPSTRTSQGSIKLEIATDQKAVASKLGMSAGGRVRTGAVTYTASAQYLRETAKSSMSLTYNYLAEFLLVKRLENSAANPVIPRPGMEDLRKDAFTWYERCGTEYVASQNLGARLFLTLRMDFVSDKERDRFAAQFGVKAPLFSADGSFEKETNSYSKNTQLKISALQIGGDPARLGNIFCPSDTTTNCRDESMKAINCSFGDLKPCMEVMAQMVAYGNGQGDEQFGGQIKGFKNYSILQLGTRPWTELGTAYKKPPSPATVSDYERSLKGSEELFEQNFQLYLHSHRLANGKAPRLSPRQRRAMDDLAAVFETNLNELKVAIEDCYESPTLCADRYRVVRERIHGKSQEEINALTAPETFAQFCDRSDDSPERARTNKALLNAAFKVAKEASGETEAKFYAGDYCQHAGEILEGMTEIDLSGQELKDLGPVGTLFNLRKLNLAKNRIVDVSPLKGLSRLEDLTLNDNLIRDFSSLAALKSLQALKLQNNRIQALGALDAFESLTLLDLRNNHDRAKCPAGAFFTCLDQDYSGESAFVEVDRATGSHLAVVGMTAAGLQNGNVLLSGGVRNDGAYSNLLELIDSDTLRIRAAGQMKYARALQTMTVLQDGCSVLIAGGAVNGGTFEVQYLCHPELTRKISRALGHGDVAVSLPMTSDFGPLRVARYGHTATLLADGRVLLVGGFTGSLTPSEDRSDITATAEIYDPATRQSTAVGSMSVPRAYHTATLLKSGKVLIAGGYQQNKSLDSMELFDPATGKFRTLRLSMKSGRSSHTAAVLSDGSVLIAGGFGLDNKAVATAEVLSADVSRTISVSTMETARGGHSMTVLENGLVLLAGGSDLYAGGVINSIRSEHVRYLAEAEIYDPKNATFTPVGSLRYGRAYQPAVAIPRGRVLVLGGMGAKDKVDEAALIIELFDYSRMIALPGGNAL